MNLLGNIGTHQWTYSYGPISRCHGTLRTWLTRIHKCVFHLLVRRCHISTWRRAISDQTAMENKLIPGLRDLQLNYYGMKQISPVYFSCFLRYETGEF